MTSGFPAPLISADDRQALGEAVAAQVARSPRPPRVLGLGEPMHGEDEFGRVRNALFAALVDQAGFTSIALETSAWHGRAVDAYVRGGDGVEDDVMAAFTHGFGESAANRELVRWMRERNRSRPRAEHLRFAGFDAPVEMAAAPSPREPLRALHDFLHARGDLDLPPWDVVDGLLGPDERWSEPAAAMDPARSIGADPRVHELRALVDDLRWALTCELPGLRHEVGVDDLDDALLACRTAAGLLAYHGVMAREGERRWQNLSAIRDAMMADNVHAIAERGPVLVFAHNLHLRTGVSRMAFGPTTLRWQPAGEHLADRFGDDYQVIATAFGGAVHQDIPEPAADTVEGLLHRGLPPGNHHLLPAPEVKALQQGCAARVSPTYRYLPVDDTLLGEVDQLLFLRAIPAAGT